MKLNYRRTFFIGLAFMSICAFWQLYNNVVPLILRDTFGVGDTVSGFVMSADNVVALFLLPIFGAYSDRVNTKIGRRIPFVLTGTAAAVVLMMFVPLLANSYYALHEGWMLIAFFVLLGVLLIAMGIYRSPAVAIMSDLTPKPLRSKANAIINLMGTVGAGLYLLISAYLYSASKTEGLDHIDYTPVFIIVAAIMVSTVVVLFFTVKEPEVAREVAEYEAAHPEDNLAVVDASGSAVLPKPVKRSLLFMLLTIALWFMGYNAIDTAFSKYATQEWDMSLGSANLCLTVALAVAAIAYIPVGIVASKIGRKRTIQGGIILLTAGFAAAYVVSLVISEFSPILYVLFGFIGIAYAATIVNTLPMVVEMCRGSDIGKFTGYYYTFSMAAQIFTPILSGALLEYVGYWTLFPYGALFVALSFVTMLFVKHGDNRPLTDSSKSK